MEHHTTELKMTIFSSILILLFELIGSTFLTLLFTCNSGVSLSLRFSPTSFTRNLAPLNMILLNTFMIGFGWLLARHIRPDNLRSESLWLALQPRSDHCFHVPPRHRQVLATPRHCLHIVPDAGRFLRRLPRVLFQSERFEFRCQQLIHRASYTR